MSNKTVHNFTIKLRESNIYDLYVDKQWVVSRGNRDNVLEELRKIMESCD